MTEYGRGPGSEPWHPEDPLYGEQGWDGQQAAHGQNQYGGQDQYGDQQQPYPQDPYAQQQYPQGQQPQQPYSQGQQPYQQGQQYNTPQDPYIQQPPQPQYGGGWDTGQQAAMPYGAQPQDPYGQQQAGYGEQQDYYGTPEAYPPPQPPGHREAVPEQQAPDWNPDVPQEETHPFFTGSDEPVGRDARDDAYDDEHDDDSRASRRGGRGGSERRGKGKKKNRSGCACLVVSLVLVGGLGGVTYFGYSYFKEQFGDAPDYAGAGSGEVEVEIPKGALGNEIANILKKNGVVKSVTAFTSAQNANPRGKFIQHGVYLLKKEMSADNAVKLMLHPKSQNALIIPEGKTNRQVYALIDKRIRAKEGTTAKVAETQAESFGLPDWAEDNPEVKDPLEGFLYPAAYPVGKGAKPEDVLKLMVARADQEYAKADLEVTARKLGLDGPWQLLTVASLVQAEGKYKHDFDKVSRVVYNRLKPGNTQTYGLLDFDSTVNYVKAESTLDVGAVDDLRKIKDPYNTYNVKGLPAGPINNPGADALHSAANPTPGPWYYFVSINEDKTLFAVTNDEHNRNREKYKEERAKSGQ